MLLQDKLVETSSKAIIPSAPPLDVATYSLMMQHMDQNEHLPCEEFAVFKPDRRALLSPKDSIPPPLQAKPPNSFL
ncbi:hypothetical protein CK203_015848 [Vitis vinifera]|uniref:Uncharacterized protein n=1 Tax=Vitis vinifera TaxID=29760 RepID=A0A438JRI8_VITVI|nr:hypothetical protein CK203_103377 [Vitis vinifera]RVX11563.1 hypothetical protein CK203_015848 [Vitis vinifera]